MLCTGTQTWGGEWLCVLDREASGLSVCLHTHPLLHTQTQDVILNKESNRETPSVVNFSERMRLSGTDGAAKMGMAPANTVHSLKRLLGKSFQDPAVQAELGKLPFSITEAPDGRCQVNVQVWLVGCVCVCVYL